MAITNDERRQVAARLREDIGLHTFAEIFGFSWIDESDWYWRDVTAKVADYVEPEPERTCRVVSTIRYEYEGGYAGTEYVTKLSCGHKHTDSYGDAPNFCSECGAKVVD